MRELIGGREGFWHERRSTSLRNLAIKGGLTQEGGTLCVRLLGLLLLLYLLGCCACPLGLVTTLTIACWQPSLRGSVSGLLVLVTVMVVVVVVFMSSLLSLFKLLLLLLLQTLMQHIVVFLSLLPPSFTAVAVVVADVAVFAVVAMLFLSHLCSARSFLRYLPSSIKHPQSTRSFSIRIYSDTLRTPSRAFTMSVFIVLVCPRSLSG